MAEYGKRDWSEVKAHPLPAPISATLEDPDDAAHLMLRRYIVEQAWEIERLRQLAAMLVEARMAEERYQEALGDAASILAVTNAPTRHERMALDVIRRALGDE